MTGSTKPYELTFEQRPDYLYAHVKALRIDREVAVSYLKEVADACVDAAATRVLIYREIPAVADTPTMFFLANYLLEIMPNVRTAFVNPFASNRDTLRFAVDVGVSRGGWHALFNNVEDAEHWLSADSGEPEAAVLL